MPLPVAHRARLQATVAAAVSIFLWRYTGSPVAAGLALVLVTLAVVAWGSPPLYAPVQHALERAARALAGGFTWTILAVVYFGLFAPLRFWRRLTGNDPLGLRRAPVNDSYFHPVSSSAPRFDRQF